jgi:hypothetical protein
MQKIKDVLRMHLLGGVGSCRQLARVVGCGKSAVADCLRRAKVANLSTWAYSRPSTSCAGNTYLMSNSA